MAIKLLTVNDVYNIREAKYIVDEENEKDLIPDEDKVQGTRVLVIEENKEYRMDSAGNWVEITKCGGCSGGLPSVTSSDNGDVLTVVDGAWAKAAPSGGGALIVNGTFDEQTGEITLDTKAGVMWAAIQAGKLIYLFMVSPTEETVMNMITDCYYTDDSGYKFGTPNDTYEAATADDYPIAPGSM